MDVKKSVAVAISSLVLAGGTALVLSAAAPASAQTAISAPQHGWHGTNSNNAPNNAPNNNNNFQDD
ncbi:MAG: hypothetical protein JWO67_4140 [Streptosporangiaceae bacterium]|nr:hypothetical protein [Streptosporangiaceae bacterium]